ncbi:hypothetical protein HII36_41305 [Nonomuraea sp. NN258]|uniref:hypothetical protein n=1 Tax=Nonomuraea antri TaxID=2730852 RepID=UPI001569AA12|nr:hypothetical protein [Nonomuraea antri]NRQ38225.1 hypothetical protein [Nonomuraea antri]
MREIGKARFENEKVLGSGHSYEGLTLTGCTFAQCAFSQLEDPGYGLVVRAATLTRCTVRRCTVHGARLEDTVIDRLTTSGALRLEACVFNRVTVLGRAGSVMLMPPRFTLPAERRAAFDAGALEFYRGVDWALDIRAAEFGSADLYWLPGALVRRDPATQFLLWREAFEGVDLGGFPGFARIAAGRFESTPFDSMVAIAPKRSEKYAERLAGLEFLRRRGLAE